MSKIINRAEFTEVINLIKQSRFNALRKVNPELVTLYFNVGQSIGVLVCKGKDGTVVEYALARNVSPALIADYETKLPDKKLPQSKIEEFAQIFEANENDNGN